MQKTFSELVASAEGKDQEAISELYDRTYPGVYKTAKTIIQDEDAVLDIVQDAYIKAFQNLHQLDDPDKFPAWVKRIAVNQAKDYLKKKKPILFTEMENEDGDAPEFRDDNMGVQPEAVVDRQDTTELINRILSTLSEEQRIAIVMFYYQELSVEEIAKAQGCSVNTVKSRLNYGRKKVEKAVLKLEKQGVKLYSMAPLPFLLWLFKAAKAANISAASLAQVSAVGAATAGAAAGTTAAGEAAAGSTAAGNAAVGTAAKATGSAITKTLTTKIVACALAITIAGGGVATAVDHVNREKENAAAHEIYESFLTQYKELLEMDAETREQEEYLFWEAVIRGVEEKYPDDLRMLNNSRTPKSFTARGNNIEEKEIPISAPSCFLRYLDYSWGDTFIDTDISIPDTIYSPAMHLPSSHFLGAVNECQYAIYECSIYSAYYDFDRNGIDEMLIRLQSENTQGKEFISLYSVTNQLLNFVDFDSSSGGGKSVCDSRTIAVDDRQYWIIISCCCDPNYDTYTQNKLLSLQCNELPLNWQLLYKSK